MKITPILLPVLLLACGPCLAEEPTAAAPDKSGYNLFHPVPDDLLRDLDTDRPDKTNGPHTLDAGRFQLETGLVGYTRNKDSGVRSENWTWADTTLRLGLIDQMELQFEWPAYQVNRDTDMATRKTAHGSGDGDLTIALKANLWGNEKGDTAGGLEFSLKTPTAGHALGNGKFEGSALFLLGLKLPGDFDLGINNGIGISANDGGGYHADIINSISVSHGIVGPLSGYVEFFSSVPSQHRGDWEGTVDVGLMLAIGKNFQVDTGVNFGVTHGADDLQTFVGMSYRF